MPRLKVYTRLHPDDWLLSATDAGIACAAQQAREGTLDDEREWIRQWLLRELLTTYHFPEAWLGTRLIATGPENTSYQHTDVFGLCLLTMTETPFLWAVVDTPGQAERAELRLQSLLLTEQSAQSAGLGISTDGTNAGTRFLRRRFNSSQCDYIADLEVYRQPARQTRPKTLFAEENSAKAAEAMQSPHSLLPLNERAENLFFEAHCRIRDIDGMHADEALDELCKILYAKLYDEETATVQRPSRLQHWRYGSDEEAAATIRSIYQEANEYDMRVFNLKIPATGAPVVYSTLPSASQAPRSPVPSKSCNLTT